MAIPKDAAHPDTQVPQPGTSEGGGPGGRSSSEQNGGAPCHAQDADPDKGGSLVQGHVGAPQQEAGVEVGLAGLAGFGKMAEGKASGEGAAEREE